MGFINKPVILMLWEFGFLPFTVQMLTVCVSEDKKTQVISRCKVIVRVSAASSY